MKVLACYCAAPLLIEGFPVVQGPQTCGKPNEAPAWVGKALEENPDIDCIAFNTENRGAVFFRLEDTDD
jgi:hypothetical protein